jgi:hypothetical protein
VESERLNSWLGILANIGVLIGIVFLAIEVRHASDTAQAQMVDSVITGHNELNLAAFSDPLLARVVVVGLYEPAILSDAEAIQFQFWMRARVNQDMRLGKLNQLGFKSAENRQNELKQIAGLLSTPGGKLFLESNRAGFPASLLQEIQPYLQEEPKERFTLGRDSLPIEIQGEK